MEEKVQGHGKHRAPSSKGTFQVAEKPVTLPDLGDGQWPKQTSGNLSFTRTCGYFTIKSHLGGRRRSIPPYFDSYLQDIQARALDGEREHQVLPDQLEWRGRIAHAPGRLGV